MSAATDPARWAARPRTPGASPAPADVTASPGPAADAAIPLGLLLQRAVRAVKVGLPDATWVVAAVTATKPARGGFSIELVEPGVARAEAGLLRAYLSDAVVGALRRSTAQAIAVRDLVGMTVVVRVTVELHSRWGLSGRVLAFGPGIEDSLAKRALEATLASLRGENLLDRQQRLPAPLDVTRLAVVHPHAAAGWGDIAGELSRWAAVGLLAVRSLPTPFEGPGAAAGIAAAVARAMAAIDGSPPDVVVLLRGGGAAVSLGALDDEALARAIATAPVPVITGLGHAVDLTLADRVAWRTVDTPSKVLALVREIVAAPARRARADHAAVLAAVSSGVDRATPRLDALERRVAAEVLRCAVAASERVDRSWGTVREAAEGARGRLARLDDGLDRVAAEITGRGPLLVGRTVAELAALLAAIRARARRACAGAEDGRRHLVSVSVRAATLIDTADAEVATLGRTAPTAAVARLDRAAVELATLARTVRERGHAHVARADDGGRALALVDAAVAERHRAGEAALTRLHETIAACVGRRIDAVAAALDGALATLDAADPARVLALGYALVMDGEGHAITSIAAATAASALVLHFADGSIAVRPIPPQPSKGHRP